MLRTTMRGGPTCSCRCGRRVACSPLVHLLSLPHQAAAQHVGLQLRNATGEADMRGWGRRGGRLSPNWSLQLLPGEAE